MATLFSRDLWKHRAHKADYVIKMKLFLYLGQNMLSFKQKSRNPVGIVPNTWHMLYTCHTCNTCPTCAIHMTELLLVPLSDRQVWGVKFGVEFCQGHGPRHLTPVLHVIYTWLSNCWSIWATDKSEGSNWGRTSPGITFISVKQTKFFTAKFSTKDLT